jgi:hypothetical protein
VEGRFLNESSVAGLRSAVTSAIDDGISAVFIGDGPLGDAVALAAAIGTWSTEILIGVRLGYGAPHRAATLVAREMSTLDQIAGGRTLVVLAAPFSDDLPDVVALWRAMWIDGQSDIVNRPLPRRHGGPPIALDLTNGVTAPPTALAACDLILIGPDDAVPGAMPAGTDVCQIQNA